MNESSVFEPEHILCPIDFSDLSALALKYAAAGAREYGAQLTVLHAETFELPRYFTADGAGQLIQELTAAKTAMQNHLAEHTHSLLGHLADEVSLRYVVTETHPVDAILNEVEQESIDLIVLGTHGRGGAQRLWLGSVAENVVRQARVPAFTIRQKEHDFIDPGHPDARPRLERLLCPVNFSEVSRLALQHAVALAQRFGTRLTVLYTIEPEDSKMTDQARDALCSWIPDIVATRCTFEPVVRQGNAAESIIAHAREEQVDLIVLGAQHRPFLEATFFGNTTELVLRHAPVPVMVSPRRD